MTEKEIIKYCVENRMSLDYGRLSICDLVNTSGYKGRHRYQVYYEIGNKFAENYISLDEAVDKFLELKQTARYYVY